MTRKTFPTLVVASAATGIVLEDGLTFAQMVEVSSHVLGFSLWSHELADKGIGARVYGAIVSQFPRLPHREDVKTNFRKAAADALAAYGPTLEVESGTQRRTEHPADSLARITGRPEDIVIVGGDARK